MEPENHSFPEHTFAGSHFEIGAQYGRACAGIIDRHIQLVSERLRTTSGASQEQAFAASLRYRPFVQRHTPFLDEEIRGIAEGAGKPLAAIYMLQLRAELAVSFSANTPEGQAAECTTFAVSGSRSESGNLVAGQNADLPAFYRDLCLVVRIIPEEGPAILMLTPAGQVSYIGINSAGVGVFGNYLKCGGWGLGFPRYLLSRAVLSRRSAREGLGTFQPIPRASSRNLLIFDGSGRVIDVENTPTRYSLLSSKDGYLVHSNHYLCDELAAEERSEGEELRNSKIRFERMIELIESHPGPLAIEDLKKFLRDRGTARDAICRFSSDGDTDLATIAGVIAEPVEGRLHIAAGPPAHNRFKTYALS